MKSVFFIDGFNLYHAVDKHFDNPRYKWLDLRKLSEKFIKKDEEIKGIFYFTAYCKWDPEKKKRHEKYITALSKKGVQIVLGKFKRVTKKFTKKMDIISSDIPQKNLPKRLEFQTFEEKETDVNLALKIVEYASQNIYDHFYVISGDSDFAPAIKHVKKNFRKVKFTSILPIGGKGYTLGQICDDQLEMNEVDISSSLLEDEIMISKNQSIKIPMEYEKP